MSLLNCAQEAHQEDLFTLFNKCVIPKVNVAVVFFFLLLFLNLSANVGYYSQPISHNPFQMKVRGHRTDKNEEYMDMREVHQHAQPTRDMNHNSRLNPVGFSV